MPIQIDSSKKGAISKFIKEKVQEGATIYLPSSIFTIYALNELKEVIQKSNKVKFLFNRPTFIKKIKANEKDVKEFELSMQNREKNVSEFALEIGLKNNLDQNSVASQCYLLLDEKFEVRSVTENALFNSNGILIDNETGDQYLLQGINLEFSMAGLGYNPNHMFDFSYALDDEISTNTYKNLFNEVWNDSKRVEDVKEELLGYIANLYKENSPELAYYITLYNLFGDKLMNKDDYDGIKEATGITKTKIWSMLFNFQRDAVVGAVHKLQKNNGCIIADSVGLGKTFEALAIIKYYELRNERVLVLCPKKLRGNWTSFKSNINTNPLVDDKFRYDVLNHTDLSRLRGHSGDIDLTKINWGNYDLVVIDESHAFRNNPARNDRVTRYSRLMQDIIKANIKTKVLMLSATPVNNSFNDLKNQIALITAEKDDALAHGKHPVQSIEQTFRGATAVFNKWSKLKGQQKTTKALIETLDYSFFEILDTYTIARSRKHIQKYYDTKDIGKFPIRRKPISLYVGTDTRGEFPEISLMNEEILKLHLAIYSPLKYVLPTKIAEYEKKYATEVKNGKVKFSQADREKNLIHLMRINILKRLESGVNSFKLTLERILKQVNSYLEMINGTSKPGQDFEPNWDDLDDEEFEEVLDDNLEIGGKIKVKLADMDLVKFKEELLEDQELLQSLVSVAKRVTPTTDLKLQTLKQQIARKINNPINPGNKKVIVFTAFADTAKYLYDNIADWLYENYGLCSGVITGSSKIETNLKGIHNSFDEILVHFSPKSSHFETDKEIDLLFATDCISEGQNLQDCDYLINYDIHWNPVRLIQRFGRVDRIGSKNDEIQLVNFWPDMTLDEYIKLETRVRDRMIIVDAAATGEDDLLNPQSKDLVYRNAQLLQLQNEVVDLDDLSGGISITDLTLDDFVSSLRNFDKEHPNLLSKYPTGIYAVTNIPKKVKDTCVPGVIYCLKQKNYSDKDKSSSSIYPFYLVYVREDGEIHVAYSNPKKVLDMYKGLCSENKEVLIDLVNEFNQETNNSNNMTKYTELLKKAILDIKGIVEQKGSLSVFKPGKSTVLDNKVTGLNDFELISFLVIK